MSTRKRTGSVAFLACGSLVRQVQEIVRQCGWDADLYALPAVHHLDPDRLVREVERKLVEFEGRYEKTVVVYGDCGTGGKLDAALQRFNAVRPVGLHCYEMLAGDDFARITQTRPGTYFLTPWMVSNFERNILPSLGLDTHPELIPTYFGNYTDLVYLRQNGDAKLDRRAAEIARLLRLRLEIKDTGLTELTRRLASAVEA
jgi:hypothetical protein